MSTLKKDLKNIVYLRGMFVGEGRGWGKRAHIGVQGTTVVLMVVGGGGGYSGADSGCAAME